MGLYKAQFISMILMLALETGIFVGFNMEWVSIEKNVFSFFDETGYADFRIISENGFSGDELKKISSIDGVDAASRYLSVNVDVKNGDGDSVALTVTENENVSGFVLISGEEYDKESADGIWLSQKYAEANGIKVGDLLTLIYKSFEISGKVKGFVKAGEYLVCVRDETQLMPDYKTHGFAFIPPAMYKSTIGFEYYPQINVISSMERKDFIEKADAALEKTVVVLTKEESSSYSLAKGESDEGKTMGSIMPTIFLLIAVLTMVTTMQRLTAKEKTQIGTLKALGFKDKRIIRHYTSYAFFIGVIGTIFGCLIGYGVAYYIMNPNGMMGTYFDMPEWKLHFPWFCYVILAAILAMLTFIGFLSVKQILKGTAADALRPYVPKNVKPLAIEKTKAFHRLSFGTRWNMRDTMRHKSRTAMSLIGIVGCMVILVGGLGMRDTMEAFLDTYYDGATNYSSRIYLSEDATDEQRSNIIKKYDGDWSAAMSVQINEKAVELDIYSTEHDYVRFPGQKGGYITLGNDGAYVCMRIAEEFGLSAGDTFKVSPYGTDDEYTLKVAGIYRSSVTENIVITPAYADKTGISYKADSVYTASDKNDIASSSVIKSIQSKQMIMGSFDSFTEIMNTMIIVLVAGALILGIVVLYNLGVMSYTERYREMATLKVVGFKDRKIGRLLIGQNMWLTLIGAIIGMPLGALTLNYLITALASEYEMNMVIGWRTYLVSVLLTFGMSFSVGLLVARKNKKIDMVEALKGAD